MNSLDRFKIESLGHVLAGNGCGPASREDDIKWGRTTLMLLVKAFAIVCTFKLSFALLGCFSTSFSPHS